MIKNRRYKSTKNDAQNRPQNMLKIDIHGGGKNHQNRSNLTGGVRGGHFYKFFEILHFFAKTLHFRTPKIDPYK
jgi:hypothetical protein